MDLNRSCIHLMPKDVEEAVEEFLEEYEAA
jgi:hypothetical protein